jgi:adenosylmethionine-8-amino-7-oxononanoate aminotransferase
MGKTCTICGAYRIGSARISRVWEVSPSMMNFFSAISGAAANTAAALISARLLMMYLLRGIKYVIKWTKKTGAD